ncbi:SWIM zinc finger family protein [Micromonospora sp. CPCC 206061]|uniref:SWIM zinc finger family protein n=1 Tax=Micromonospora sp. CPCC 206061 TaxID=3122410 RepID=UPI002FEFF363
MSYHVYGRTRKVDGGLKARSARGKIGESWWSRRFLDVLESFAVGTRLTRGRSYARAGQVLSLDVSPGAVTASVQGSRATPYQVRVGLAPFTDAVWTRIENTLAAQAIYSARLLAGDLPPDLERLFEEGGAPLFPRTIGELDMRCSCPDHAVPCKHLAATFYLLAEAFDADPFQILHWRGRSREALLARLRGPAARTRRAPAAVAVGTAPVLTDVPDTPLEETLDRFWLPPHPLPSRPQTLDTDPDLLLRQLPAPGPLLGGPGLLERLRPLYRSLAP